MPAWVAASIIASRAFRLPGSRTLVGSSLQIVFMADSASPSLNGFALRLTNASIAWVSESVPVSAVSLAGMVSVSS